MRLQHISGHSDLLFSLKPMLQRVAVSRSLFFIELIGPLCNPGLLINSLDRPWLAIYMTGSRTIGCCASCKGLSGLHGLLCKRQPHEVVPTVDRCQTYLTELAQPIDLIKELVPCEFGAIRDQLLEPTRGVTRKGFQYPGRNRLRL